MPTHRATIFSNGIADFQRSYSVSKNAPTEISLPVRKDHIADVLASLNVFGPVTLTSPPSFRPSNDSAGTLAFDPSKVIEDLATRLSGAKVSVSRASGEVAGTLVGLHSEPEATGGERILPKFLVVLTNQGLTRIPLREVSWLQFQDDEVQKELDKALERNLQQIKPHSTFVTLTVATEQDSAEALLQYTLPAAAWKISYRLRSRPQAGDADAESFDFQGFAIVDNNTDEDWNDFLISVVTGEPITFSTDLADSKIPHRDHVNVVKDRAFGSVEVEEADFMQPHPAAMAMADITRGGSAKMMRRSRPVPMTGGGADDESVMAMLQEPAETADADVQMVGDFCVFESPAPVTIAAQRSAVIPVFQTTLSNTESILHYKHENHAERPFRSIQFQNETEYSLGRGVCTVYDAGVYAGSCVLPAVAPGDDALLPHALETGVRLRRELAKPIERVVGLRLANGICYTNTYEEQTSHYDVRSSRDENYELVLDHDFALKKPNVSGTLQREEGNAETLELKENLKAGMRFSVELNARERLRISVVESRVVQSSVRLVSKSGKELRADWLETNLVYTNGPLANEPGIQKCLEIQSRLGALQEQMQKAELDRTRLAEKQDRLRKNIGTGGNNEQTDRWRTDLGKAEDAITEIEETLLPELSRQEQAIRDELRDALRGLSAEWSAR